MKDDSAFGLYPSGHSLVNFWYHPCVFKSGEEYAVLLYFSLILSFVPECIFLDSAMHGPSALRVHELVVAAGFLGASLSFLDF